MTSNSRQGARTPQSGGRGNLAGYITDPGFVPGLLFYFWAVAGKVRKMQKDHHEVIAMGRKTITMMLRKARSIGRKKELALTWADQRQADIFVLVKRLEAAISRNDHDDITIATGRLQELIGRTYEALPRVLDELSKTPVIDCMGGDLTECGAASLDECLDWAQGQIATGQALLTRLYQAERACRPASSHRLQFCRPNTALSGHVFTSNVGHPRFD